MNTNNINKIRMGYSELMYHYILSDMLMGKNIFRYHCGHDLVKALRNNLYKIVVDSEK